MAKIKPQDMVDGALKFYKEGYGYIWGATGGIWTQADQNKVNADPNGREQTKRYGQKWVGKHVIDCSGIPYRIAKDHGIKIPHGSNSQYLKYCPVHGELKSEDQLLPGAGVFKYSEKYTNPYYHVGIYVDNKTIIEAKSTYAGVVETTVKDWINSKDSVAHYGYWSFVDWNDADKEKEYMETLKRGSRGEKVVELQNKLNSLGYDCGTADGIFGTKTYNAVKAFQIANGLTADGIAGYNTLTLLKDLEGNTPAPIEPTKHMLTITLEYNVAEAVYDALKIPLGV